MPKIITVEPNISKEENERNLKQVMEVLERIAQELANEQYEKQLSEEESN